MFGVRYTRVCYSVLICKLFNNGYVENKTRIHVLQVAGFSAEVDDVKMMEENEDGSTTVTNLRGEPNPVRKPSNLLRELIRVYSKFGDVVVEVACGSAPAARASLQEGRVCLSVDRDPRVILPVRTHLIAMRERLSETLHTKQISLKRKVRVGL